MSKKFRSYSREQQYLLPPSLDEWLPEGHLSRFVVETVGELDLAGIYDSYSSRRGKPPYDPAMMVGLLLYAYCVGTPSSRKVEQKTHEDIGFRYVAANQQPDHDTISSFRRRHLDQLAGLFLQVLRLCQKAGLVKLGHVSLDGTKIKANASKHKAMSYGRMLKKEKDLEREIWDLLERAEKEDLAEDSKYGKGVRGWDLPGELNRRSKRLGVIRKAMKELEQEALDKAEAKAEERKNKQKAAKGKKPPGKKPPAPEKAKPKAKAQKNFTDPESRIMKDSASKSFVQAYNAQACVDEAHQVIVAASLTQRANDKRELQPIVQKLAENLAELPEGLKLSADAGYFSEDNVKAMERAKIDAYIAVGKVKHGEKPPSVRGRPPKDMTVTDRMRRKLATKKGKAVYARRKVIPEPVFGQMKHCRGLRGFLLRGFEMAKAEWQLFCLTHNLLKLYRYGPA
jgi:transposase